MEGVPGAVDAGSGRPVLLAIDEQETRLERVREELERRYGDDYSVLSAGSAGAGLKLLEELRKLRAQVAVVLADEWLGEQSGSELLGQVRRLHPFAKRGLLVEWGAWADRPTADALQDAMARGYIDYYVLRPLDRGDEQFHRTLTDFLYEWSRHSSPRAGEISLIGRQWQQRSTELRSLLARNGVPHSFHASDSSSGRALVAGVAARGQRRDSDGDEDRPILVLPDGRLLTDPSNAELADAIGVETSVGSDADYDVVIVGAGAAGLAAAVYASSEGLRALVIERESIGGQAGSTSLIRNYLGFARGISGGELAQRAYQQAWVFGTRFLMMREVGALRLGRGRHAVGLVGGAEISAKAVVLATGVSYRRIGIASLERFAGRGVFYGAPIAASPGAGEDLVHVVGGGNSAGQAALALSRSAEEVALLIRGPSLQRDMSDYLVEAIRSEPKITVLTDTEVIGAGGEQRLESLELRDNASGTVRESPASAVYLMIGAQPRTDWLPRQVACDGAGYVLAGRELDRVRLGVELPEWPLERAPLMFETLAPRVFVVGDAMRGSVKRVASAVGQGSVVIAQVHECLRDHAAHGDSQPVGEVEA